MGVGLAEEGRWRRKISRVHKLLGSLTIVEERDQSWRFARTTTMCVARDGAVKIEAYIPRGNLEERDWAVRFCSIYDLSQDSTYISKDELKLRALVAEL